MATNVLDIAAFLRVVRADGDAMASIPTADLGRRVPSCPDWDVAGLVGHTSWVHRYVTAVLAAGPSGKVDRKALPLAPEGEAVRGWYRQGLDALLEAFDGADLAAEYTSFIGPQRGEWWARRMAHETSVHHWDAANARGEAMSIEATLAVDGVTEAIDTYATRRFDHAAFGSSGQTVHLHATDAEGEWLMTMDDGTLAWQPGHHKGDVAVRGPASSLQLWVMSRVPTDAPDLDVVGDADVARRWQSAASF